MTNLKMNEINCMQLEGIYLVKDYEISSFKENVPIQLEHLKNYNVHYYEMYFLIQNCIFQDEVALNSTLYHSNNSRNEKKISTVVFENCLFKKELKLNGKSFECELIFNDCIFEADVNCQDTVFSVYCDFSRSIFLKSLNLSKTSFDEKAYFKDVVLNKIIKLNLRDTYINEKTNFLNISSKNIKKKCNTYNEIINYANSIDKEKYLNVANRETARIIKDSFEQQNNIIEANKFYALEMEEREKELKFLRNPLEWLVFKIHSIFSNHSQDWFLALIWIILFSCIVTVFNQRYFYEVDRYLFIGAISINPIVFAVFTKELLQKIGLLIFTFIFIKLNEINWDFLANQLNPFSIMTGKEELSFGGLIYKIIIAYLIYQLIISIRQNTRRK